MRWGSNAHDGGGGGHGKLVRACGNATKGRMWAILGGDACPEQALPRDKGGFVKASVRQRPPAGAPNPPLKEVRKITAWGEHLGRACECGCCCAPQAQHQSGNPRGASRRVSVNGRCPPMGPDLDLATPPLDVFAMRRMQAANPAAHKRLACAPACTYPTQARREDATHLSMEAHSPQAVAEEQEGRGEDPSSALSAPGHTIGSCNCCIATKMATTLGAMRAKFGRKPRSNDEAPPHATSVVDARSPPCDHVRRRARARRPNRTAVSDTPGAMATRAPRAAESGVGNGLPGRASRRSVVRRAIPNAMPRTRNRNRLT